MDSGWAVVIGAAIALVGSSVVPWIREALAARSTLKKERRERVREAIIDLSTATARAATAHVGDQVDELRSAIHDRARALSRLMMEVELGARAPINRIARLAIIRKTDPMHAATALQLSLAAWYAGDARADQLPAHYEAELARQLPPAGPQRAPSAT